MLIFDKNIWDSRNVEIHNSNATDLKKPMVAPLWSPVFWLTKRFRKATAPRILTQIAWSALNGGKTELGIWLGCIFWLATMPIIFYYFPNIMTHFCFLNHKKPDIIPYNLFQIAISNLSNQKMIFIGIWNHISKYRIKKAGCFSDKIQKLRP